MKLKDIEQHFDTIISKQYLSVGIDKIGIKAAKRNDLRKKYSFEIFRALSCGKYKFTKYKQLLQLKRVGNYPRIISIPCLRDRLLFKTLYEEFLKVHVKRAKFEKIIQSVSRDTKNNNYNCVAIFDIKNFFNSVPHKKLEKILNNENIPDIPIKLLLKSLKIRTVSDSENSKSIKAVDSKIKKGIPQGIIVGNALAEIYAQKFDDKIAVLERKTPFVKHYRFVDDILVFYNSRHFSKNKIKKIIIRNLSSLSLRINKEKMNVCLSIRDGFNYLGFRFKDGLISVRDEVLNKKQKSIERIIFDFASATHPKIKKNYDYLIWKLNLEITGFIANQVYYGWTSSYRFLTDYSQLRKLDLVMKHIYERSGLEADKFDQIKSFRVAHNSIKKAYKRKTKYIPNFDFDYDTVKKKRLFLEKIYSISSISSLSDEHINELFYSMLRKEIQDVERDLDLKYGI